MKDYSPNSLIDLINSWQDEDERASLIKEANTRKGEVPGKSFVDLFKYSNSPFLPYLFEAILRDGVKICILTSDFSRSRKIISEINYDLAKIQDNLLKDFKIRLLRDGSNSHIFINNSEIVSFVYKKEEMQGRRFDTIIVDRSLAISEKEFFEVLIPRVSAGLGGSKLIYFL